MSEQPVSERAMRDFVKKASPILKTLEYDHRHGYHEGYPFVGCLTCLLTGKVPEK